ncbi:MAG: DUF2384 domain-containing protein [Flavobacteriales bacterium]|nr:DUF2384 domain-containing protein [Flavobacteriales bacterium]
MKQKATSCIGYSGLLLLELSLVKKKAASAWIKSEVRGLGYKKPIEMVRTTAGYDMVVDLLGRLSDGVVT